MSQPALTLFSKIRSQFGGTLNQPIKNNPTFNRGWAYLASLLIVAVLFTLWLDTNQVEAHPLFQSPQSPQSPPPPAQAPPPAEPPPAAPPPAEQPPVEQPQVAQPAPVQPAIEAAPPVEQNPAPATPDQPEGRNPRRDAPPDEPESGSKTGCSFDQAEFIDTMVVSGAYVWLCCGVILLLMTPLGLLFLYIQGRSKIIKEERYKA